MLSAPGWGREPLNKLSKKTSAEVNLQQQQLQPAAAPPLEEQPLGEVGARLGGDDAAGRALVKDGADAAGDLAGAGARGGRACRRRRDSRQHQLCPPTHRGQVVPVGGRADEGVFGVVVLACAAATLALVVCASRGVAEGGGGGRRAVSLPCAGRRPVRARRTVAQAFVVVVLIREAAAAAAGASGTRPAPRAAGLDRLVIRRRPVEARAVAPRVLGDALGRGALRTHGERGRGWWDPQPRKSPRDLPPNAQSGPRCRLRRACRGAAARRRGQGGQSRCHAS